jgi:uncharacterized membrane protein YgcG
VVLQRCSGQHVAASFACLQLGTSRKRSGHARPAFRAFQPCSAPAAPVFWPCSAWPPLTFALDAPRRPPAPLAPRSEAQAQVALDVRNSRYNRRLQQVVEDVSSIKGGARSGGLISSGGGSSGSLSGVGGVGGGVGAAAERLTKVRSPARSRLVLSRRGPSCS